jgi:hypothetical protein
MIAESDGAAGNVAPGGRLRRWCAASVSIGGWGCLAGALLVWAVVRWVDVPGWPLVVFLYGPDGLAQSHCFCLRPHLFMSSVVR